MAKLSRDDYYDIADNFAKASAAVLDFRVRNKDSLSARDRDQLERFEDELDHQVVMFRNYGITISGNDAEKAQTDLNQAVRDAKAVIDKINVIKETIELAASLLTLASAIASVDVGGIFTAIKGVQEAIKTAQNAEDSPQAAAT
jgi:uncharacterized Zn finger protein